jgi:hypothetical protein
LRLILALFADSILRCNLGMGVVLANGWLDALMTGVEFSLVFQGLRKRKLWNSGIVAQTTDNFFGGIMAHEIYDVWEDQNPRDKKYAWRAQMVNYVGEFKSQETADNFVAAVKKHREESGLTKASV